MGSGLSTYMNSEIDCDVIVVGGGITGLATAWYVRQHHPETTVAVLEASPRVGGKIASATVAGHRVDCGPDAFLARVPGAVELADELGLRDSLVAPATGQAWVWSRGRLRALPEGLVLGVPSRLRPLARSGIVSWRGVARAALGEVRATRSAAADPTVADAIGAHLGREVVDRLVDPLLGGINASSCDRLSLASAAPNIAEAAASPRLMRALRASGATRTRGQIGVEQSQPVFLAPSGGVSTMVVELTRQLPAGTVRANHAVRSIERESTGSWLVMSTGGSMRCRRVVLATPASIAAALLRATSAGAADQLGAIRASSVALTLLAYRAADVALPPGSGMLVPRIEGRMLTASSWWHQKWPHLVTPGTVLVRASAGRDGDTRFTDLADDALIRALTNDLGELLGLRARPIDAHVTRWPDGFPQYDSGHAARVEVAEAHLRRDAPGIALAGASYRGIGIPACIRSAKAAATAVTALA